MFCYCVVVVRACVCLFFFFSSCKDCEIIINKIKDILIYITCFLVLKITINVLQLIFCIRNCLIYQLLKV